MCAGRPDYFFAKGASGAKGARGAEPFVRADGGSIDSLAASECFRVGC